MTELKLTVTIKALELAQAIESLAAAINVRPARDDSTIIDKSAITAPAAQQPIPAAAPATPVAQQPVYTAPAVPTVPVVQQPVALQPVPMVSAAPAQTSQLATSISVTQRPITQDILANAGADLLEKGMMPQLMALLTQFGVQSVTMLRTDQYTAFAEGMRALGANI